MRCPFCGCDQQRVLDSRPARAGEAVRRRRECESCRRRFTTFEAPEIARLLVIKRDGSREEFDREKLLRGLLMAARKRPISIETLREVAERIERDLLASGEEEVVSGDVGERAMRELLEVDTVAYVRFASVYRKFETLDDFVEIVRSVRRPSGRLVGRVPARKA